ncbi:hypothetical protein BDN72DRAFT_485332 [Pluteus cervinus]|uniref:Uncharacterized protein n=1 Tax=Pluteus cervinus TaxID=181527 RepID=A0ACD3A5S2_9AGAR|nr:hypothetical protein BDN72DRAFT_485332 [Pluteus cervinus]
MDIPQRGVVCSFFLRNACAHGAGCRFLHPNTSFNGMGITQVRGVCAHYQRDACRYGDRCRDLHIYLTKDRPFTGIPTSPQTKPFDTAKPTVLCKYFLKSSCTKGTTCQFSHNFIERQKVADKHAGSLQTELQPLKEASLSSNWRDRRESLVAPPIPQDIVKGTLGEESSPSPKSPDLTTQTSTTLDHINVLDRQNLQDSSPTDDIDTTRSLFSCTVDFGAGAAVDQVITPFESRRLVLSNLPVEVSELDITSLVADITDSISVSIYRNTDNPFPSAAVTFPRPTQAAEALEVINTATLHSQKIAARLDLRARAVEGGTGTLMSRKVKVQWYGATASAIARYSSGAEAAKNVIRLNGYTLSGSRLKASLYTAKTNALSFGRMQSGSVMIHNLPANISKQTIKEIAWCDSVSIRTHNDDVDSPEELIRRRLESCGALESFTVLPAVPGTAKVTAFAQFGAADAAAKAVSTLSNTRLSFLGNQPLMISPTFSLKYLVRARKFSRVQGQVEHLSQACLDDGRIRFYCTREDGTPADPVTVILHSKDPKGLGRVKVKLEPILRGETLVADGKNLWDEYFERYDGQKFIRGINLDALFFVEYDLRSRVIRLFGDAPSRAQARELITTYLREVHDRLHIIPLPRESLGAFIVDAYIDLQTEFGQGKISLNVVARTLTVHGDQEDVARVRRIISDLTHNHGAPKSSASSESLCPVCFCDAVDPLRLTCGHTYCRQCIQHYLRCYADSKSFSPVKCVAEVNQSETTFPCHTPVAFSFVRQLLTPAEEKNLLDASFLAYVQAQPNEFHFCPSPDCQMVYRRGAIGTVLQCPSCLLQICSACHTESHEGMSCAEYQDSLSGGLRALAQWKAENGIKQCPNCKADIEKNGGCNHITCLFCKVHICWVCMKLFRDGGPDGGIYPHMRAAHGGIGL